MSREEQLRQAKQIMSAMEHASGCRLAREPSDDYTISRFPATATDEQKGAAEQRAAEARARLAAREAEERGKRTARLMTRWGGEAAVKLQA